MGSYAPRVTTASSIFPKSSVQDLEGLNFLGDSVLIQYVDGLFKEQILSLENKAACEKDSIYLLSALETIKWT